MASFKISNPFQFFTDASGAPLDAGYVYIGTTGLNPETNPISVYWDSAMTIPAAQPIRTVSGYPSRNGKKADIYVAVASYSITVKDKSSGLIAYQASMTSTVDAATVAFTPDGGSSTTVKKQLDAYSVSSMSDFISGSWSGLTKINVLSFFGSWHGSVEGPIGQTEWHFDGTTGGTQTVDSTSAIQTAMSSGKVIDSDGRGWVMTDASVYYASSFGAVASSDNSSALTAMLTLCAARKAKAIIDVDSILTNITVPTYMDLEVRANLTHSSTATACFKITDVTNVKIDFGSQQGFTQTRSGNKKFIDITGTSDYANESIEIRNGAPTGGTGNMVEWYACKKLWFIDFSPNTFEDGPGIYSIANSVTHPYKSSVAVFHGCDAFDITGTSNSCHGISINAWNYVDSVFVHKNVMSGITNNPIEIWANKAHIWENQIQDGNIPISCGACHWLLVHDNVVDITTPTTAGDGGYGIEIGACHFFNVHHNIIRGCRNGIRTTGGAINGGTNWYNSTELYSEAGTLYSSDTSKLNVLSRDYASGVNFSGSYAGIIDGNIILDSLNSAVYVAMDYYQTRSVKVTGNLINRVGRYDTPTDSLGAIACINGRFELSANTIEDSLNAAIYNSNSRVVLGPNTIKKCAAAVPIYNIGLGSSFNMLARQDLSECTIAGPVAGTTPTQGTWYAGDTLYSHTPAAGGSLGIVCTTGGTQSTQLNTRTATTVNGSADVVLNSLGDAQIGVRFTIAGVTGTKTITDINYSTNTLTVDVVCDASVSGAAVTNASATFKALPSIAA